MKATFAVFALFLSFVLAVPASAQIQVVSRKGDWQAEPSSQIAIAWHPTENVCSFGGPNGQIDLYRPQVINGSMRLATLARIQNTGWGQVEAIAMEGDRLLAVNAKGQARLWILPSLEKSNGIINAPSQTLDLPLPGVTWLSMVDAEQCCYLQGETLRQMNVGSTLTKVQFVSASSSTLPFEVPGIKFLGRSTDGSYFFHESDFVVCDRYGKVLSEINVPSSVTVAGVDHREGNRLTVEPSLVHVFRPGKWRETIAPAAEQKVASARLLPDGGVLLLGKNAELSLHRENTDPVTYHTLRELRLQEAGKPEQIRRPIAEILAESLAFSTDGKFFAVGGKGTVEMLIGMIGENQK